jgi:hypothetical protein
VRLTLCSLALLCCLPAPPIAQTLPDPAVPEVPEPPPQINPSQLSDTELLDLLAQIEARRAAAPWRVGLFGAKPAFVLPRGFGFVAGAATNRRDRQFSGDWDGSLAFGVGFGDADRGIGVMPVIDITSVSPYHFGSSGKVGIKFSRNLAFPGAWQGAASLDLHNLLTWGDSSVLDPGWSVAVSAVHPGRGRPVLLTLGQVRRSRTRVRIRACSEVSAWRWRRALRPASAGLATRPLPV